MNYTERGNQLGFSAEAVMDTKNLVFKPEYRVFCEENRCGNYDRNPACPPESGSVEEMKEKALSYNKTLVLQTTQSNDMDYKKAKLVSNSFPNVWKHRLFISAAVPFQELRTKVEPSLTLN